MTKKEFIKSKVHRVFKNIERFKTASPSLVMKLSLEKDEEVLGIYENYLGIEFESIVITTLGLYLLGEKSVLSIKYSEIAGISSPQTKDDNKLLITLKNGNIATLQILGGNGQFRDIFSFLRFLNRVIEHLASG